MHSKHRRRGPYFKNKIEEIKRKTQTNLKATSKTTGIQHTFGNIAGWEKLMDEFDRKVESQRSQLIASLHFYNWLKNQSIDKSLCSYQLKDPCFRFANPKYGPISLEGSLAYGGRFNIGSSQMDKSFPDAQMYSCLYISSSQECAVEEAAKPIGTHKLFQLTPKIPMILWDLSKVIDSLNYTNLLDLVKASQGERIWAYQKLPTESQLLAHELRKLGGDGIIFNSTKLSDHQNIALFFSNNDEAISKLEIKQI